VTVAVGVAAVVAAVLLVIFLTGRGNAGVADGSTSALPSASASEMPSAGPSTEGSPTATPRPSATATPGGPTAGQQVLELGWGRADTTLNLRDDPGTAALIQVSILRDEVLRIVAGPEAADGYDWYLVQTLDYSQGWVASGPASDPFVSALGSGTTFETCGAVTSEGRRIDGLRIGYSDPVFDSMRELSAATDGEACVTFVAEDNSMPRRYVSMTLESCARPVFGPNGYFGFKPTTAGDVAEEWRLKRRVNIPNAFFEEGADMGEDQEYDNKWAVFLVGKNSAEPLACVSANLDERPDTYERELAAHLMDCITVIEEDADRLKIMPSTGSSYFLFSKPANTSIDPVTVGEPRLMKLEAGSRHDEGYLSLTDMGSC
jgi:hypothetical protein